jgi:uncharacterized protein (DUF849 family)
MRRAVFLMVMLASGLVAAGCGPDTDTPTAEQEAFDQAVVAVAAEVNLHHLQLDRATTMDEVRVEATRHDAAMRAALDSMRERLEPLDRCAATTARLQTTRMDAISTELGEHEAAISAAADLAAVRAELERYDAAIMDLLARLRQRWTDQGCL